MSNKPKNKTYKTEKLQKILANAGLGSRRELERYIVEGQVKVNDKIANLGDRANENDIIYFRGRRVHIRSSAEIRTRVLIYHKPEGEICSNHDPEGRPSVFDSIAQKRGVRWIMVGRLDFNTSGLLMFTNDGELANKLMHPSNEVEREYAVRVLGELTPAIQKTLLTGVELEDGMAKFEQLKEAGGTGANKWYHVVLKEGRNREVRRLLESQSLIVSRLIRIRFGNILLPSTLRKGKSVELSSSEVEKLF